MMRLICVLKPDCFHAPNKINEIQMENKVN